MRRFAPSLESAEDRYAGLVGGHARDDRDRADRRTRGGTGAAVPSNQQIASGGCSREPHAETDARYRGVGARVTDLVEPAGRAPIVRTFRPGAVTGTERQGAECRADDDAGARDSDRGPGQDVR